MGLTRSLHTGCVLASCPHFFSIVFYSAHFIFLPKPVSLFMISWPKTEGKKCFICQHFTLQARAQQAINNVINTVNEKKKKSSVLPLHLRNIYMIFFSSFIQSNIKLKCFSSVIFWVFAWNRKCSKQWTARECCAVWYFCHKHLTKLHIFFMCNADLHSWLFSSSWTQPSAI